MPGETHFFDDIYARRGELGDFKNLESVKRVMGRLTTIYGRYNEKPDQERVDKLLQKRDVFEELSGCRTYEALFSRFMEIQTRFAGKRRWGNNVPKDIFQIKEIVAFYPNAKVLVCIRDVRDFLISYQNKWHVAQGNNAQRLTRLYHPVLTSLLWHASVKQITRIKEMIPNGNLSIVRYESLVQNPEQQVREICRFIGENFEEDMLNVDVQNSSFQVSDKGIYSASVGRWLRLLSNEEVYIAQKISGGRLEEFGYAPAHLKINPLKVGCILATLPYGVWRAIHANREIRGPLLPYVVKRLAALWQAAR
jgi:hypothetical protein